MTDGPLLSDISSRIWDIRYRHRESGTIQLRTLGAALPARLQQRSGRIRKSGSSGSTKFWKDSAFYREGAFLPAQVPLTGSRCLTVSSWVKSRMLSTVFSRRSRKER